MSVRENEWHILVLVRKNFYLLALVQFLIYILVGNSKVIFYVSLRQTLFYYLIGCQKTPNGSSKCLWKEENVAFRNPVFDNNLAQQSLEHFLLILSLSLSFSPVPRLILPLHRPRPVGVAHLQPPAVAARNLKTKEVSEKKKKGSLWHRSCSSWDSQLKRKKE